MGTGESGATGRAQADLMLHNRPSQQLQDSHSEETTLEGTDGSSKQVAWGLVAGKFEPPDFLMGLAPSSGRAEMCPALPWWGRAADQIHFVEANSLWAIRF